MAAHRRTAKEMGYTVAVDGSIVKTQQEANDLREKAQTGR